MNAGPRYPFVWLGLPLALIVLFTVGPLVGLLLGGAVAGALGCNMPIAGTMPCLFMGADLSEALAVAVALGYLAFFTMPAGTTLLGIWLIVAVLVTLVWWLRRRRAA
jgi:ACR3 family arsenite efflux pump ArsB